MDDGATTLGTGDGATGGTDEGTAVGAGDGATFCGDGSAVGIDVAVDAAGGVVGTGDGATFCGDGSAVGIDVAVDAAGGLVGGGPLVGSWVTILAAIVVDARVVGAGEDSVDALVGVPDSVVFRFPPVNGAAITDSPQQATKSDPSTAAAVPAFDLRVVINRYHHWNAFIKVAPIVLRNVDFINPKNRDTMTILCDHIMRPAED